MKHTMTWGRYMFFARRAWQQGDYAEAEKLYLIALGKAESVGRPHWRLAASFGNLAEIYRLQGRYAEAEPLFRRAIEIDERCLNIEFYQLGLAKLLILRATEILGGFILFVELAKPARNSILAQHIGYRTLSNINLYVLQLVKLESMGNDLFIPAVPPSVSLMETRRQTCLQILTT